MSTVTIAKPQTTTVNPAAANFRRQTTGIATAMLTDWVGPDRAKEAGGRLVVAMSAAAASAKNPQDFYDCTPQSVAAVIAISALTGIHVGTGSTALAYAIPRRPRKGEAPQLQYQLSHRGINALAGRADRVMIPIPIGKEDKIEIDDSGDVKILSRNFDDPPTHENDLRGIVLVVKIASTGSIIMRQWVAQKVINERRAVSDSFQFAEKNEWAQKTDPWHRWYVEQAMKTAMHYGISRGWCVIDDTEAARALAADVASDIPALEHAPAGSRSDQVSQLLGNDPIPAETIESSEANDSETDPDEPLVNVLKRQIAEATTNDQLEAIVAASKTAKDAGDLTEEQRALIDRQAVRKAQELAKAAE